MVSTSGAVHRIPAESAAEPPKRSGLFEHDDAQPALRRRSRRGQPSLSPSDDE